MSQVQLQQQPIDEHPEINAIIEDMLSEESRLAQIAMAQFTDLRHYACSQLFLAFLISLGNAETILEQLYKMPVAPGRAAQPLKENPAIVARITALVDNDSIFAAFCTDISKTAPPTADVGRFIAFLDTLVLAEATLKQAQRVATLMPVRTSDVQEKDEKKSGTKRASPSSSTQAKKQSKLEKEAAKNDDDDDEDNEATQRE